MSWYYTQCIAHTMGWLPICFFSTYWRVSKGCRTNWVFVFRKLWKADRIPGLRSLEPTYVLGRNSDPVPDILHRRLLQAIHSPKCSTTPLCLQLSLRPQTRWVALLKRQKQREGCCEMHVKTTIPEGGRTTFEWKAGESGHWVTDRLNLDKEESLSAVKLKCCDSYLMC